MNLTPSDLDTITTEVSTKVLEVIYKKLPLVITVLVAGEVSSQFAIRDFFDRNKDLVQHKKLVISTFQKLSAKYPEKESVVIVDELLDEAVRKELGGAPTPQAAKGKKPAFAGRR